MFRTGLHQPVSRGAGSTLPLRRLLPTTSWYGPRISVMRFVRCGLPALAGCPAVVLSTAAGVASAVSVLRRLLSASSQAKGRSSAEMPMELYADAPSDALARLDAVQDGNSGDELCAFAARDLGAASCTPIGGDLLLMTLLPEFAALRQDAAACRHPKIREAIASDNCTVAGCDYCRYRRQIRLQTIRIRRLAPSAEILVEPKMRRLQSGAAA